jgi:penicillin amidase
MTYREAIIAALKDELDEAGFEFVLAQRYSTNVADLWFDSEDNPVWDDPCTSAVEKRGDVLKHAFRKAVEAAAKGQGKDPSKWRWGAIHKIHFSHLFGSRKILDSTFNLKESEAGGALDSVWKSHFDMANAEKPFKAMAGPVYRMVVDLANPRDGRWIVDTGSSGWPSSPHYGDQYELWKKGEMIPMWFDPGDALRNSKATLIFR